MKDLEASAELAANTIELVARREAKILALCEALRVERDALTEARAMADEAERLFAKQCSRIAFELAARRGRVRTMVDDYGNERRTG